MSNLAAHCNPFSISRSKAQKNVIRTHFASLCKVGNVLCYPSVLLLPSVESGLFCWFLFVIPEPLCLFNCRFACCLLFFCGYNKFIIHYFYYYYYFLIIKLINFIYFFCLDPLWFIFFFFLIFPLVSHSYIVALSLLLSTDHCSVFVCMCVCFARVYCFVETLIFLFFFGCLFFPLCFLL